MLTQYLALWSIGVNEGEKFGESVLFREYFGKKKHDKY
jgi:hypothetical protein